MAMNPANELVSALQSVHIREKPSIEHDIAPETSVDRKVPIDIIPSDEAQASPGSSRSSRSLSSASSTIPSDIIRARPRRRTLPPFPDFRFEQSYLASIKNATSNWQVAYITIRDQLVWPLLSGCAYNLAMFGWRYWNRETKLSGVGLGAKIRRWWWEVNNWKVPSAAKKGKDEFVRRSEDVSLRSLPFRTFDGFS